MTQRTLLQFFHWYYPAGGTLWDEVAQKAPDLAQMGITDVWLPPATKGAAGDQSIGYDVYDLFDLGEFDQKGSRATRYGTREQLQGAIEACHQNGLGVLHDAVLNHRMGADDTQKVPVRRVNPDNRLEVEEEPFEAQVHTRFTFPGRGGTHSDFVYDADCFSGVDCITDPDETGVFRICNPYGDGAWNDEVDGEFGNFDYLMGADLEYRNPAVQEEIKRWGRWMVEAVGADGFRLDAVKHIPAWFIRDWVGHLRDTTRPDLFVVGEYWNPDPAALGAYLERTDHQLALFDVALHHAFHHAGRAHADYDLRQILDGSLVALVPEHAVTVVANHDTQPLQALEAPVEPWFKPLAYALILLRESGVPCVFYPDLYGARYEDTGGDGQMHEVELPAITCLPALITARQRFAHGAQTDLFDAPDCIGFIRHGTADAPGCVVVLSNAGDGHVHADLGPDHAGATFVDWLGHWADPITLGHDGVGDFPAHGQSVSVWVHQDAT